MTRSEIIQRFELIAHTAKLARGCVVNAEIRKDAYLEDITMMCVSALGDLADDADVETKGKTTCR